MWRKGHQEGYLMRKITSNKLHQTILITMFLLGDIYVDG